MAETSRTRQLRDACNPLFGSNKLKLGTFCSNLKGGCAITTLDGVLDASWGSTLSLAQMADQMGFEALVPVGRWQGFGGASDFNGEGFECFTWAAGIGASTRRAGIFATSHVPTIHPVMAAKQAMTIDHITNGRFALNLVTGWHKTEIEMFGAPLLEHARRYDCAVEWLDIIKRLWVSDEPVDFDGEFYKVIGAQVRPHPVQRPHPVVMNAGGSERGRHFAAKYCDVAFVILTSYGFDDVKAQVDRYRELARREYGRDIQVWSYAYVVQGDTEADARAYFDEYVHKKGDQTAVETLTTTMGINAQTVPPEVMEAMKTHFIAGWGGFPLVGTKEQIVDGLAMLQRAGFDGILLSWARYLPDMAQFQAETWPLLVQAGLRS